MAKPADEDPRITGPDTAAVHTVADLARLLRQLRRRDARHRGDSQLTYRELAAKTGWSRSLIGLYLSGQALPPTDRFDVLVQLLGASPAEQGVLATIRDRVEEGRHTGLPGEGRPSGPAAGGREERLVVPRALPAPTPHFIGRENERRMLTQLIKAHVDPGGSVAVVVIGGTAGVGKTALAVHWAHRVADRFPDGQLYVNLRGFDPAGAVMDPAEAVRGFLDALRVPPQRIPAGLDAQAALYRSLLAGRRMLVVLDNARDTDQVRPLLPGAPGLPGAGHQPQPAHRPGRRRRRPPAHPRPAHRRPRRASCWPAGSARDRVAAEPEAVEEIVTRCARLPLALAIVAARAATHPQLPLADLAGELRDARRRLDALAAGDPATDVRAVFSWSYRALHPGRGTAVPAARPASRPGHLPPRRRPASPACRSPQVRPLLAELTRAQPGRRARPRPVRLARPAPRVRRRAGPRHRARAGSATPRPTGCSTTTCTPPTPPTGC